MTRSTGSRMIATRGSPCPIVPGSARCARRRPAAAKRAARRRRRRAEMGEQLEQVLREVAARFADARLHVFDVRVAPSPADDGIIRLTGRVLDGATLQAVRHAVLEEVRGARLD